MTVQIGTNPIAWTNDDMPELGGDIPLEICLSEASQAGYAGIEMGGKFPRESAKLAPLLAGHGLRLISGWYDGRILLRTVEEEFDAVLPHLTLLRDLGCKVVVYADTSRGRHDGVFQPLSLRPKLNDDDWVPYGRKLTGLADRMMDFGVRMAFHHHMGTIVQTDREIDLMMRNSGESVGLLYDTGHCIFAQGDPAALLSRHIGRVVHVHCKDARPDILDSAIRADSGFMPAVLQGVFTVPGDGCIDFLPLLTQLHDRAYEGWLVVEAEQDPRKADPLIYAKKGFDYLLSTARAAGFDVRGTES